MYALRKSKILRERLRIDRDFCIQSADCAQLCSFLNNSPGRNMFKESETACSFIPRLTHWRADWKRETSRPTFSFCPFPRIFPTFVDRATRLIAEKGKQLRKDNRKWSRRKILANKTFLRCPPRHRPVVLTRAFAIAILTRPDTSSFTRKKTRSH